MTGSDKTTPMPAVLVPGRTCWRVEPADRLALIVDAAAYFAAARAAILRARRQVLLIGWDFDLRIKLTPGDGRTDAPDELGAFLNEIVRSRPDLQVHILKWDLAAAGLLVRGRSLLLFLRWLARRRIHMRLASDHPAGAAHHQKIIVIDDALAFCGGIDMTADRWDTPAHADGDPRRVRPDGTPYGPYHDVAIAVDGAAARAMGELARERWWRATGHRLGAPPPGSSPWPDDLEPDLRRVDVAIARTAPAYDGRPEIREIQHLYLEAIAAARHHIYLECQYFASETIARALEARLQEPDGPEIVVVNLKTPHGWLESAVMDPIRARLVRRIQAADRFGRFRICTPVTAGGADITVHAKVVVVDDALLRVGSSNLNNRSMGFDTECDLAVEAAGAADEGAVRSVIAGFRNRLLAEHLGVEPSAVAKALAETGSLARTLDTLRRRDGRTLEPFKPPDLDAVQQNIATDPALDPDAPEALANHFGQGLKDMAALVAKRLPWRPLLVGAGGGLALLLAAKRRRR